MKRILCFLLALLTVFSIFPVQSLATELTSLEAMLQETEPAQTFPEETLPQETFPEETFPEETLPEETLPEETEPSETAPDGSELGTYQVTYQRHPILLDGQELSQDDLFAGYAESELYGKPSIPLSTGTKTAGSRLTGDEARAYKAMVPIIKQLANGTRSSAIITMNPYSSDASVTFQQSYKNFDYAAVFNALWYDLAYEMYWSWSSWYCDMRYYTANNLLYEVKFSLAVEPKFRNGSNNYYVLNTAKTSAAKTAASNAKAIVNKYSGKPDYDKLLGYCNEICNLNTYNWDAFDDLDSYASRDYGPWQVLYVFDKKSSTNAVCGGYAKAFQYLCDMGGLTCYYILGYVDDYDGYHAWNIVTLQGKNYMVDVTNIDGDGYANDYSYFLWGGSGSASGGYYVTNGRGNRYYYFYQRDNDHDMFDTWGTKVLTLASSKYKPCNPHKYTSKVTKAATCTSTGTQTNTCSGCGHKYTSTVPKTGHTYAEKVIQEPSGNSYGTMRYTCTGCGTYYTKSFRYASNIYRVAGDDRCQTARLVANVMKKQKNLSKFNAIIYASGDSFPDALVGSYLSVKKTAPILLYRKSGQAQNLNYILSNLSSTGIVYILGSSTVVPDEVENELKLYGIRVKRLAGSDRFETNIKILKEAGFSGGEILVCTGYNFADSLSASATGKPILLVNNGTGKLTTTQKNYLKSLKKKSFTIIGGTSAVSNTLATALKSYGTVGRVSGSNRYETSVAVAKKYISSPKGAVLAYAANFPDGLCGGPLAYMLGMPLILTADANTTPAENYVDSKGITRGYVLGSYTLISSKSARKIFNLAENQEIKTN